MASDDLDYPQLVRAALRAVPRAVLLQVADSGLPAGHSLYLSFDATAPGVEMPAALRAIYPQEMTIVLERQYWNLEVESERFAVTLSFGGQRQRVTVPFSALSGFADPPAEFGLRFEVSAAEAEAERGETPAAAPAFGSREPTSPPSPGGGEVVPFDRPRKR